MAIIVLTPSQLKQISVDHPTDADFINTDNDNVDIVNSWYSSNPANFASGSVIFTTALGKMGISAKLSWDNSLNILSAGDNLIASVDVTQDISGLSLVKGAMNTLNKYGSGIRFCSTDINFTTRNPKLLAGIFPRATQTYTDDTTGGMAIDFFISPNNPGADPVPTLLAVMSEDGLALTRKLNLGSFSTQTINANVLETKGLSSVIRPLPETGTSDNLDVINGNNGDIIILFGLDGNTVTLRDEIGNLRLDGNCQLASTRHFIVLHALAGTGNWYELTRKFN